MENQTPRNSGATRRRNPEDHHYADTEEPEFLLFSADSDDHPFLNPKLRVENPFLSQAAPAPNPFLSEGEETRNPFLTSIRQPWERNPFLRES